MTVLSERIRAVNETRFFLGALCTPSRTPKVPTLIRKQASGLLKHFPYSEETNRAYLLEAVERKEPLY